MVAVGSAGETPLEGEVERPEDRSEFVVGFADARARGLGRGLSVIWLVDESPRMLASVQ